MSPRMGLDLQTILQAATEIADTQGLGEVTLASLAKKLQVRSPSLYNHIDGLPGLRKMLAIHGLKQLNVGLALAVTGRSGDDAIYALSDAYMSFARQHPGLYEATVPAGSPEDVDIHQIGSDIVAIFLRVLHAYGLEDELALHATRGLRSLLHGFASIEHQGGFGLSLDLDYSIRLALGTFLAGMQAKGESIE